MFYFEKEEPVARQRLAIAVELCAGTENSGLTTSRFQTTFLAQVQTIVRPVATLPFEAHPDIDSWMTQSETWRSFAARVTRRGYGVGFAAERDLNRT